VVRIASARVNPVRLQFARPVGTARGEFTGRDSVLLELRDREGTTGQGEAAPWPGFGTETVGRAHELLCDAAALLEGRDAEPGERITELDGLLADAPAARAAVQGALWDLAARRAGRPLAHHLASHVVAPTAAVLTRVPLSALLVAREPDELRAEAARARAAGYLAVKLKLGTGPLAADVARVQAARAGLGPGVRLRGDANGAWSRTQAIAALAALAEYEFEYIEQPLAADDVDGLVQLRGRAPVRIAADESVATEQGARRLLAAGAADVVVLKPATLGGPAAALEIAAQARSAGVGVTFTHTFESAVGAHHALHCAAAWGDPGAVHGLATEGLFVADVAAPVAGRAGFATIDATPGIGVTP
jgi:o-succinylbenzoate synthase